MYHQHFGLNEAPFSIAVNPRYLFMSQRHRDALAHLLYGVSGGGGFILLTGEVGTGKMVMNTRNHIVFACWQKKHTVSSNPQNLRLSPATANPALFGDSHGRTSNS